VIDLVPLAEGIAELIDLAERLIADDRLDDAAVALEPVHQAARMVGDGATTARTALMLGRIHHAHGRPEPALAFLRQAGLLLRADVRSAEAGEAWDRAGTCLADLGRWDEAVPVHRRAVDCFAAAGQPRLAAMARGHMGRALVLAGEHREGLAQLHEALRALDADDHENLAVLWWLAGDASALLQQRADAVDAYEHALRHASAGGHHHLTVSAAERLAPLVVEAGLHETHAVVLEQLHQALLTLEKEQSAAETADHVALALREAGHGDEALAWHARARRAFEALGSRASLALCHQLTGSTLELLGRHEEAIEAFGHARALAADLDDAVFVATLDDRIGVALHHLGRFEDSEAAHRGARLALWELGAAAEAAVAGKNLGWTLAALGRDDEAVTVLRAALPVLEDAGWSWSAQECSEQLDRIADGGSGTCH
jgi:tetratricopeptide (TPR) repeat protein